MTFKHFDSSVRTNEFWMLPIERINQNLERNHAKDTLQRSGISAVYGCPLPENILDNIRTLQSAINRTMDAHGSATKIAWRKNPEALHFSVYGLIMPDDYLPTSWPLSNDRLQKLQEALHQFGNFELQLQGVGILGMGAVSIRVSDSLELERLRDAIGSIEGVSQERFGSRTKKIVIGRVLPPLTAQSREIIRITCDNLQALTIGTLKINSLEIIHYKNTFLEQEYARLRIE